MSNLINQTVDYTRQARSGVITHAGAEAAGATPAQRTASFARGGLSNESGRDELMHQKMQFVAQNEGRTPFGTVQASESDFQWLQKKRESEAYANLDAWVGQNFHTADVATRKWLQETFPEYYESRERMMIDRAKLALRIKLLLLRGPKNHKDLILQWGLQTGRIQLDRDWDRVGTSTTGAMPVGENDRFKSQLFAPPRFDTDANRTANATMENNPFRATDGRGNDGQYPNPFVGGADNAPLYPGFLAKVINQ